MKGKSEWYEWKKIEKEGGTEERVKKEKVNGRQKVSKTKVRSRRRKEKKTGD